MLNKHFPKGAKPLLLALAVSSSFAQADPLREILDENTLLIGSAMMTDHIAEKKFAEVLKTEFNLLTPENEMKWSYIQPQRGVYDFSKADKLVEFAEKNGMEVRGHALVWHIQNPEWLEEGEFTREELLEILEEHIKTVAGHYKGRIKYWDVVNEALDDAGGWRETIWYKGIGEEYIAKAFQWAHEADPDALLYYNDYSTEGTTPKANAAYRLVKQLQEQGVPIHGAGTQLHLISGDILRTANIAANIERHEELGLEYHFTEVDIRIQGEATDRSLAEQASMYEELMKLALHYEAVNVFTTWGLTDKYSWIPWWFNGWDHGLLLDKQYEPKPAYHAVQAQMELKRDGKFEWQPPVRIESDNRYVQAFVSPEAPKALSLNNDASVWADATFYPFAFNQLEGRDQRLPSDQEISGKFAVMYKGNTLYGRVEREDNITVNTAEPDYENDSVEVFLRSGKDEPFVQYRAIVGQDFGPQGYDATAKGVWHDDGKVFEFAITPNFVDTLAGKTWGFNIALSDNDKAGTEHGQRSSQLYPVTGTNSGYLGEDFAEIFFPGQNLEISAVPFENPYTFKAVEVQISGEPGSYKPMEWLNTYHYSFAFNQLDRRDMSPPAQSDLNGSWQVGYQGNVLYGVVHRHDDVTVTNHEHDYENDNVEVFLKVGEQFVQLRSIVGQDFQDSSFPGKRVAKWNDDGTVMSFAIELPLESLAGERIGFNIALADTDDVSTGRSAQLYPVPGTNAGYLGEELTVLDFVR